MSPKTPADQVTHFLDMLAAGHIDEAIDLLAERVVYTNVSLPSIRGRERVRKVVVATLGRPHAQFEVYIRSAATEGNVVLNERIDVLSYGPLRVQFWVFGRFEVSEEKITVWRDSFDWLNICAGFARGLVGIVLPGLRAKPPAWR